MDIKFDAQVNSKFRMEPKDIADAVSIKMMMNTEGWKILKNYFEIGKEAILDKIKEVSVNSEKESEASKWGSALKGWDQSVNLADRIVSRMEEFIKRREEDGDDEQPEDDEL